MLMVYLTSGSFVLLLFLCAVPQNALKYINMSIHISLYVCIDRQKGTFCCKIRGAARDFLMHLIFPHSALNLSQFSYWCYGN